MKIGRLEEMSRAHVEVTGNSKNVAERGYEHSTYTMHKLHVPLIKSWENNTSRFSIFGISIVRSKHSDLPQETH
jgi:hypothetical protein